ncbi:MAG: J domain-containing protein [Candidatus Pacebacteria bacterium]|nr:J domain-containing protein [Candidatus Paceibacterota bacterium]
MLGEKKINYNFEKGLSSEKTHYDVLGIERTATVDEIKRAFWGLAKETHPDKGGDEEEFKRANEAYEVLSDSDRRAIYDAGLPLDDLGVGWARGSEQTSSDTIEPDDEGQKAKLEEGKEQKAIRARANKLWQKAVDDAEGIREELERKKASQASKGVVGVEKGVDQSIRVIERDGLFIGTTGGLMAKEYLLSPDTKQIISDWFDQIIVRDGLVIGKRGYFNIEHLLDKRTGRVIGEEKGFSRIEIRDEKVVGIRQHLRGQDEVYVLANLATNEK